MQLTIVTVAIALAHATQGFAAPVPATYEVEDLVARSEPNERFRNVAQRIASGVPNGVLNLPFRSNVASVAQKAILAAKNSAGAGNIRAPMLPRPNAGPSIQPNQRPALPKFPKLEPIKVPGNRLSPILSKVKAAQKARGQQGGLINGHKSGKRKAATFRAPGKGRVAKIPKSGNQRVAKFRAGGKGKVSRVPKSGKSSSRSPKAPRKTNARATKAKTSRKGSKRDLTDLDLEVRAFEFDELD